MDQPHISWNSPISAESTLYQLDQSYISCISLLSAGTVPYQLDQPHISWISPISAGSVPFQVWMFRRRKKCVNPADVRTPYLPGSSLVSVRLSVLRYKLPVMDKTGGTRINITLKSVLIAISAVEKQSFSYFEYVCVYICACVALFIQRAMRMLHIILSASCLSPSTTFSLNISLTSRFSARRY